MEMVLNVFSIITVIITTIISYHGIEGSVVKLCTFANGKYRFINNIPLANRTSLIFAVKSCQEVRLLLTGNSTSSRPAYEIIIGRAGNTKSRITTSLGSQYTNSTYYTVSSPVVLDCKEFRHFWILWKQTISVGKGQIVGVDAIATTTLSSSISVDYIGIKTISDFNDTWIFQAEIVTLDIVRDIVCTEQDPTSVSSASDEATTPNAISTVDTGISTKISTSITSDKTTTFNLESTSDRISKSTTWIDNRTITRTTIISDKHTTLKQESTTGETTVKTSTTYNGNSLITDTVTDVSSQHGLFVTSQTDEDVIKCMCPCYSVGNNLIQLPSHNLTTEELRVYLTPYLTQLEKAISVNSKSTAAYKATKISASDERMSSSIMGWFGALILGTLLGFLVMFDILCLFIYCKYRDNW